MRYVEMRREESGQGRASFCREIRGKPGSVYTSWLNDTKKLTVTEVVRICRKFQIRPVWALYKVGPVTEQSQPALCSDIAADPRHM
jgi:hypothetical protein